MKSLGNGPNLLATELLFMTIGGRSLKSAWSTFIFSIVWNHFNIYSACLQTKLSGIQLIFKNTYHKNTSWIIIGLVTRRVVWAELIIQDNATMPHYFQFYIMRRTEVTWVVTKPTDFLMHASSRQQSVYRVRWHVQAIQRIDSSTKSTSQHELNCDNKNKPMKVSGLELEMDN